MHQSPHLDLRFDRKADPFQLKDIAKKAKEMYTTLREFMAELRTC